MLTCRKPSLLKVAQGLPQLAALIADDVIAEVAVRAPRIAVPTETFREVEHETQPVSSGIRGQAVIRGFRASGCTFVASITVNFPAPSRFAAMKCSTSKASFVAAWLFSSSETSPRQKSEESTSVGMKWVARKSGLAGARGADQAQPAPVRES